MAKAINQLQVEIVKPQMFRCHINRHSKVTIDQLPCRKSSDAIAAPVCGFTAEGQDCTPLSTKGTV